MKSKTLFAEAAAAAKTAREVAEKADAAGREMTAEERGIFDAKFKEATEKKAAGERAKKDEDIMAQAKDLARIVGDAPGASSGRSVWSKDAAGRLLRAMPDQPDGSKALVSGSIGVPEVIDPEVVRMGEAPTTLLDLVPKRGVEGGGNTFSFLRQTVRTNNAAPVADGETKPTSIYTLAEVEDEFQVIAHLSEALPLRYFRDHALLEDFLRIEMELGLELEVEDQILNGDGQAFTSPHDGTNLTGILNTSGIQTQAFATDILTSLRAGITKLSAKGVRPTAVLISAADAESLDNLREDGSTGAYLLGGPANAAAETLWSIPRVVTSHLSAGTAVLGDFTQAELVIKHGSSEVAVDYSGTLFDTNRAKMRVEGRYGVAVKRPFAFVDVTTASG